MSEDRKSLLDELLLADTEVVFTAYDAIRRCVGWVVGCYSTLIAKPIRTSNPIQRIVAVGAVFDIKKVGKCSIKA